MHIPDGYLSPETCAGLYAAALPFWYAALRRVKRMLNTRAAPLLAVFAAFSFVIMMFNLPLPGGTTGHAVGMGIAAIVLGPWAAMLAISIALVIQALFFGDGGITAIGANCFNMAIAGSLVTYALYRVIARGAPLGGTRRVVAAAIGGYAAINVSALLAAVEFGIQPMLFRDASGAPLYCPYPVSISIPAMMIGHLTFAGLAELMISAGVFAYLQRADPSLLRATAPDSPDREDAVPEVSARVWPTARKLWIALGLLLALTPLGILAAGTAWGEWTAQDLARSTGRAPQGLERLSSLWNAPIARYAPGFIHGEAFGYLVSAIAGVGLIILLCVLAQWLLSKADYAPRPARRSFVERTIAGLLDIMDHAIFCEELARQDGFLQRLDPRVKLAGLLSLVVAAASVRRLWVLVLLLASAIAMAVLSRVPLRVLSTRVWLPALSFSGVIAIPAIFLTEGSVLYRIPIVHWAVSSQGLTTASYLLLRVLAAATFSVLLVLCTEWTRVLRALRFFRIPTTAVVILGMTYRYVFLFLRAAHDMFESRRSRLVGRLEESDRRRLAAASVGVLLSRSFQLSSEVHAAMQSRGFQGEVYVLDELAIGAGDWLRLAGFVAIAALALVVGR